MNRFKTIYAASVLILFWYLLHFLLQSGIIPSPYDTFMNFISIFPEKLFLHLLYSLWRVAAAVGISLLLGVSFGLWLGLKDKADKFFSPIVYLLYPIPKIAFLPVFMIFFGLGDLSKIILITAIIIFQIIVTARDSVKELTKELFYSAKSLGMNTKQIYLHVIIPAVLPKILTALRISVGTSIAVLFLGENFATTYGIGYFIMNSWTMVNYVEMFSGIIALSLMGMLLFKLIDLVEDRLCLWIKAGKAENI
ncbi:MAG: ABC transporter permease [Bacillota bacterium]